MPKHLRFEFINRIVLEFGFSVVLSILRFKRVEFFMDLFPQKKKKGFFIIFFMGLACFQNFLMLVERDIMGLMFIGFYFLIFVWGFHFYF